MYTPEIQVPKNWFIHGRCSKSNKIELIFILIKRLLKFKSYINQAYNNILIDVHIGFTF